MAALDNEAKNLRLLLELVDREVTTGQARAFGSASIEFFDRRDQAWWPFIRLPVVYLDSGDEATLTRSLRELCGGQSEGFAFRAGELGFQIGKQSGEYLVEVGMDLFAYLTQTSGRPTRPGGELALFRFVTTIAELARFANQLEGDIQRLPRAPER